MKKIFCVLSFALLFVGCGSKNTPEGVVEECWKRLSEGNVREAVALMAAEEGEVALYRAIFEEQSGELVTAGGMVDFEVLSLSEGEKDASVEAIVTLANGQKIDATYKLVKRENQWLITE